MPKANQLLCSHHPLKKKKNKPCLLSLIYFVLPSTTGRREIGGESKLLWALMCQKMSSSSRLSRTLSEPPEQYNSFKEDFCYSVYCVIYPKS